ncbi:hypothetical protein H8356DRAFT_1079984 [Neocallimastix lanati (nom. inval.)]|jgi:hypothetical protein|uniref:Uncharacterized protein n=1 Tax=Neocallimastix californiae TaxID=1754190 RepID=A0A1Y2AH59_9FUNG|nr:hypothetical protein H8356DRAFT_972136 [Neocallimastix sp. JGI-2020a]KAG4094923.1 hypothetical protein H8356DRAFT_1079984 [Neocallimastix sp. JGI-2020a]ORY21913.1 hypothetical protein LY90DRAFT_515801 [Neocallimastix californiae]|eukprot:ORY21913.1 hypothetical protein LY90DRAFT_515801 [Neocallimastix californiae]
MTVSEVEFIAFGSDNAWYIKWGDGRQSWNNLPHSLHNKLNGRQKSLPEVVFLSLSPNDDWFVRFADGSTGWSVCSDEMDLLLQDKAHRGVQKVIFGQDKSYLIMFANKETAWNGIPYLLHKKIMERQEEKDVYLDEVALSGDGSWYVKFTDGRYGWYGLPSTLDHELERRDDGAKKLWLSPANDWSYFVLWEDGTSNWHHEDSFTESLDIEDDNESLVSDTASTVYLNGEPIELTEDKILYLDPKDILYSQESIDNCFRDGRSIRRTMRLLRNGEIKIEDFPPIKVCIDKSTGNYYTTANKRLWVYREAGLDEIPVYLIDPPRGFFYRRSGNGYNIKIKGN